MKTTKQIAFSLLAVVLTLTLGFLFQSCSDEEMPTTYYTSVKLTAAGFISSRQDTYSQFEAILNRANYYTLLSTYGKFTLFAPTNAAVDQFLKQNGWTSVDQIPQAQCDTIARTHIVKRGAYFTTDVSDAALPEMNMNDRYITISSDSDVAHGNALVFFVNKTAKITERDDSVTNGVVHTIDHVLGASNLFLPDLIDENPELRLFSEALHLTGMKDSISKYLDESYTISLDSVVDGVPTMYGGRPPRPTGPRSVISSSRPLSRPTPSLPCTTSTVWTTSRLMPRGCTTRPILWMPAGTMMTGPTVGIRSTDSFPTI